MLRTSDGVRERGDLRFPVSFPHPFKSFGEVKHWQSAKSRVQIPFELLQTFRHSTDAESFLRTLQYSMILSRDVSNTQLDRTTI